MSVISCLLVVRRKGGKGQQVWRGLRRRRRGAPGGSLGGARAAAETAATRFGGARERLVGLLCPAVRPLTDTK